MKPKDARQLILIAVVLAGTAAAAALALTLAVPLPTCAGVNGVNRTVTIIADLNGYNGSRLNEGNGPVIQASRCDTIRIIVVNKDIQAHGLSVTFYALNGIEVSGGETASLPAFVAVKTGIFRIYCNTQCTVHNSMQAGALIVN